MAPFVRPAAVCPSPPPVEPPPADLVASGPASIEAAWWVAAVVIVVAGSAIGWACVVMWRHHRLLGAMASATEALAGQVMGATGKRRRSRRRRRPALGRLQDSLEKVSIALLQSRSAHRQLDAVLASMTASVVVVEPGSERIRSVNDAGRALFGVEPADLQGAVLDDLFGEDADSVRGLIDTADAGDFVPRNLELEICGRDGRSTSVLLSTAAVPDSAGRHEAFVVLAQEIGDLRRVEERLHKINVRLWLTNELTAIGLRVTELEPAVEQMAQAMHGSECFRGAGIAVLEADQMKLRFLRMSGFGEMPCEGAKSLAKSFLSTVLEQQEPILLHNAEGRLDFDDALLGTVDATTFGAFPLQLGARRLGLLMLAAQESSDAVEEFGHTGSDLARHIAPLLDKKLTNEQLRRSNQDLLDARVAAEEANRAKSDFLANMSHEIRTPMTAILGYADLVRDGGLGAPEAGEFVRTIRRNGEHLLAIINDILDISKIEAGKMTVERVPCSPARIAQEIVEMMRRRADDKQLELTLELQWPLPREVLSDPTRLRQVLSNLVGNALKFTQTGGVRLVVSRSSESDERVVFEVADTGIGLSGTELTRIFRPFSQADTSHTRRFGGTGLGLAISQRLAGLLGGGLSVHSRKGVGSTFCLEIDGGALSTQHLVRSLEEVRQEASAAADANGPSSATAESVSARVLLAEDGLDNQRLISFILRKASIEVDVVSDGQQAYDVVLMDMQMPVLDGYAATRSLRTDGYRGTIVALTAHAMAGDREKCLDVGCDEFLTKPIDRAHLLETIAARVGMPG